MSEQDNLVTCGCQTEGLAIFPTRYTVVPNYIKKTQPTWANLAGVTTVPLNDEYHYHIRRVRAGFIYIYLNTAAPEDSPANSDAGAPLSDAAQMAQENKHWLIYSIDEQGRFVRQTKIQSVRPVDKNDDAFKCPNLQQNPSLNAFITIPNPERYSKVYIAYSEFPWTVEAMQEYRKSPLPRMQELDIKAWQAQQQQTSATIATEQTLGQILDFDFDFIFDKSLPYNHEDGVQFDYDSKDRYSSKPIFDSSYPIFINNKKIYKEEQVSRVGVPVTVTTVSQGYEFKRENLKFNASCQPWCEFDFGNIIVAPNTDTKAIYQDMHAAHLHTLHKNMQNYSGSHGSPMVLALEDALGIAEELNGYYNDIYGHLIQFQHEAKMECDVKQYLAKIRAFFEAKVAKDDFDLAPYKDDLYTAIGQNSTLDNVDYKNQVVESLLKKQDPGFMYTLKHFDTSPQLAGVFGLRRDIDMDIRANLWGINTNSLDYVPPVKREFYQMVKSYILLVKEHFFGKPSGAIYYKRFMNYLKSGTDTENDIFVPYYKTRPSSEYYLGTIYEKFVKYSRFEQDASAEETKSTSLTLHQLYQKLVSEYAEKEKEHKQEFDNKVDKELEKYTSRLDSTDFDKIVTELDQQVNLFANQRAKLLTDWLEKSHYLNFINDLSYEQDTEISSNSELWLKYQEKIEQELQEALEKKEISVNDVDALKKVNLNGFYFASVLERSLRGLDASEQGREFTKKLYDLEQLAEIEVESRVYIKTKFWVLGLRALCFDANNTLKVLNAVYKSVDEEKKKAYEFEALKTFFIERLSLCTIQFRAATLKLEYFKELQHLQKIEGLTTIALDTTFGQKRVIIKWLSNYNSVGYFPAATLKIYDNLVAKCSPIGNGLYSMGAMIAEAATLAISGVIWQTGVVYAHLKYQLMQAWITFKSQAAPGINIGGGFKLLSNAYPAQAKKLIKQLRDSLNTVIKQLDGRFVDNLVDIEAFFKKTLNLSFKVFSDATTAEITRKQVHLRSARLAFLVGAFEVYNWQYIMDKKPSLFASDSDIAMEKLVATSSLVATASDFVAYSVRAVRGKATTSFAYAKLSFGGFSGLIGFFAGIKMAGGAIDHFKRGNYLAGTFGLLSSAVYLTSGGLNIMLGLTYRYEWILTFFEKRAQNYMVSRGIQKAFNLFALRFILLRFAGILGIAALVVELLYDYFADNEIQVWLSYSALGIYKQQQKFTTSFEQARAFEAIDMLQAVIEEKTNTNISELQKQAIEKIQQDHESVLLQAEQDALKWIL